MKTIVSVPASTVTVASGTALIAATYGLVRLAYGLVLPDVQHSLGFGAAVAGWTAAGSSVLYCVGALVGFVAAPTHPRLLVVLAGVSAGAGAVGMATSPSPVVFSVAAVVASAGAGLASPALVTLVQHAVRRDTARAQSVVNSGTGPGLVVAGLLALLLLPEWRAVWWVAAVATVVAAAAVLLAGRAAEQSTEHRPAPGTARPAARPPRSWLTAHRRLLVVSLLLGAGSAAVWTYGRTLLVEAGAPAALSVTAWVALGVGGTAVAGTARWVGRLRARSAWAVTTGAVAVATATLALAPQVTGVALAACVVFGWGYTAATGALIAWTTELDPDRAPAGTSLLFVVLVLGQALGAAVAGAAVDAVGTGAAFLGAAVVTAVGAVGALPSRLRGSAGSAGTAGTAGTVRASGA
jgi:predicted MFS family arabinose efflux permease